MGLGVGHQVLGQPNLNHCRELQVYRGLEVGPLETIRGQGCGNSACEGVEATASALSSEAKSVQDAGRGAGLSLSL